MKEIVVYALLLAASASAAFGQDACGSAPVNCSSCPVYTEGGGPVNLLNGTGLELSDADNASEAFPSLQAAFVELQTLTTDAANVTLTVNSTICDSYGLNCTDGIVSGRAALHITGNQSIVAYQKVLLQVKFNITADEPDLRERERMVALQVSDGKFWSEPAIIVVAVNGINDNPPMISVNSSGLPFVEGNSAGVKVASSVSISDIDDDTFVEARVTILNIQDVGYERLSTYNLATYTMDITNGTTLVVTGNGDGSTFSTILESIRYMNDAAEPNTTLRIIKYTINDGKFSSSYNVTVAIKSINDNAPMINVSTLPAFKEGGKPLYLFNDTLNIYDADSINSDVYIQSFTAFLILGGHNESLMAANTTNIPSEISGDRIVFSGNYTLDEYQMAARSIVYVNTGDELVCPLYRTINLTIEDGMHTSGVTSVMFNLIPYNDNPPMIRPQNSSVNFTEGSNFGVLVFPILNITDADEECRDNMLQYAHVTLNVLYTGDESISLMSCDDDLGGSGSEIYYCDPIDLDANNVTMPMGDTAPVNITRQLVNGDIRLTITGEAPLQVYQDIIQMIFYNNTVDEPELGDRTVSLLVNDGRYSYTAYSNITIIPVADSDPVVNPNGDPTMTENEGPISIILNITDDDQLVKHQLIYQINITLYNRSAGDVLLVNGSTSDSSSVLINCTDCNDLDCCVDRVQNIMYNNTADEPYPFYRTFAVQIEAVGVTQLIRYVNITIELVNDNRPVIQVNGSAPANETFVTEFTEDGAPVRIFASPNISDQDVGNNFVTSVTIEVDDKGDMNSTMYDQFMYDNATNLTVTNTSGFLEISGSATAQEYMELLSTVRYFNTLEEPNVMYQNRNIIVTIREDNQFSMAYIRVRLEPLNDPAQFNFSNRTIVFYEANREPVMLFESSDVIVDPDNPDQDNATLTYATLTLSPVEHERDTLSIDSIDPQSSLMIDANSTHIYISGVAPIAEYVNILRTATFVNRRFDSPPTARRVIVNTFDGEDNSIGPEITIMINETDDPPLCFFGENIEQSTLGTVLEFFECEGETPSCGTNLCPEDGPCFNITDFDSNDTFPDDAVAIVTIANANDATARDMNTNERLMFADDSNAVVMEVPSPLFMVQYQISNVSTYIELTELLRSAIYNNTIVPLTMGIRTINVSINTSNTSLQQCQVTIDVKRTGRLRTVLPSRLQSDPVLNYIEDLGPISLIPEELRNDFFFNVSEGFNTGYRVTLTIVNGSNNDPGQLILPNGFSRPTNVTISGENTAQMTVEYEYSPLSNPDVPIRSFNAVFRAVQILFNDQAPRSCMREPSFDGCAVLEFVNLDILEGADHVTRLYVAIEGRNDQPVLTRLRNNFEALDNYLPPRMNTGFNVSFLITENEVMDADRVSDIIGLAIVNATNGTVESPSGFWQYRNRNNGSYTEWTNITNVSDCYPLFIPPEGIIYIRFYPIINPTQSDANVTLTLRAWDGTSEDTTCTNETVSNTLPVSNTSETFTYQLVYLNRAPLTSVQEYNITTDEDVASDNVTVATIVMELGAVDPEGTAELGIAVTFVNNNNEIGYWQYQPEGTGDSWINIPYNSTAENAFLLYPNDSLRFSPADNYFGSTYITVLAAEVESTAPSGDRIVNTSSDNNYTGSYSILHPSIINVTVDGILDAPILDCPTREITYYENAAPVYLFEGLTITSVETDELESATVKLMTEETTIDMLHYPNTSYFVIIVNDPHCITINATLNDSIYAFQDFLRQISFSIQNDTEIEPDVEIRTVSLMVTDSLGTNSSKPVEISITLVNDQSLNITIPEDNVTFIEDSGQVQLFVTAPIITDPDDNPQQRSVIHAAYIFLYDDYDEDFEWLSFNSSPLYDNITGYFDDYYLCLSGPGTVDQYEEAFTRVYYHNNMTEPSPNDLQREVFFELYDGRFYSYYYNNARIFINIILINDQSPTIQLSNAAKNNTVIISETSGPVHIAPLAVITDEDSDSNTSISYSLEVEILNPYDDEVIFRDYPTDASTRFSIGGPTSIGYVQQALRQLQYLNRAAQPTGSYRLLRVDVFDTYESGSAFVDRAYVTVELAFTDDLPQLNFNTTAIVYEEGDGPVQVAPGLTIVDDDDTEISSAIIELVSTNITLNFSVEIITIDQALLDGTSISLSRSYGRLILNGTDSIETYENILRSLTYEYTIAMGDPMEGKRMLRGYVEGVRANTTGEVDTLAICFTSIDNSPIIDLNGVMQGGQNYSTEFVEEGDPVAVTSRAAFIEDVDSSTLQYINITLINPVDENEEGITIDGYYNHNIQYNMEGSLSTFTELLRNVTYFNTADEPDPEQRVIVFVASDGSTYSTLVQTTVNISLTDDIPQLYLDGDAGSVNYSTVFTENDGPVNLTLTPIVDDIDAINVTELEITLVPTYGTVTATVELYRVNGNWLYNETTTLQRITEIISFLMYEDDAVEPLPGDRLVCLSITVDGARSNVACTEVMFVPVDDSPIRFAMNYSGAVFESEIEVNVTQVIAEDRDSINSVVNITYNIVNVTAVPYDQSCPEVVTGSGAMPVDAYPFTIDPISGWISTTDSSLDRETYSSYVLIVEATDGENRDTTYVTIAVEDINDNCAVFYQTMYSVTVPQGAEANSFLVNLTACDPDGDPISVIINDPGITMEPAPTDHLFGLSGLTFQLLVDERLLIERNQSTYDVIVCIKSNVLSVADCDIETATVRVNVQLNNDTPQFTEDHYRVSVPENTMPTSLLQVVAVDGDAGTNGNICYSLISNMTSLPFAINRSSGIIMVTENLDYEYRIHYYFLVCATDKGYFPKSSKRWVEVWVENVNDEPPVFNQTEYIVSVFENVSVPYDLIQVQALDIDSVNITYELDDLDPAVVNLFQIDAITGLISVVTPLDHEGFGTINFTVRANDSLNTAEADISVRIIDINETPVFTMPIYNVMINESFTPNMFANEENTTGSGEFLQEIVQVTAIDPDGDNITYFFPDPQPYFVINAYTGVITSNILFDRELVAEFSLPVRATDDANNIGSATVEITVVDVNDNTPIFAPDTYSETVAEDITVGSSVLQITVCDLDESSIIDDTNIIQFDVPFNLTEPVMISDDCHESTLILTSPLDHEDTRMYSLTIEATDAGDPLLTGTGMVSILVSDVDDNPPVITITHIVDSLPEVAAVGSFIANFTVTDEDTGINAEYRIVTSSGVTATNGTILLAEELDYENATELYFTITAIGVVPPSRTATVNGTVLVEDVNDVAAILMFERQMADFFEGFSAIPLTPGITITDVDSTMLYSATVNFSRISPLEPQFFFTPNDDLLPYNCPLEDKFQKFVSCGFTDAELVTSDRSSLFNGATLDGTTLYLNANDRQHMVYSGRPNVITNGVSILFWVRKNSVSTPSVQPILTKGNIFTNRNTFSISCLEDNSMQFSFNNGTNQQTVILNYNCSYLEGSWHHMGIVLSPQNNIWTITLHIDDIIVDSQEIGVLADESGQFLIGTDASRQNFFNGVVHLAVVSTVLANNKNDINCAIGCGVTLQSLTDTPLYYKYSYNDSTLYVSGMASFEIYEEFFNSLYFISTFSELYSDRYTLDFCVVEVPPNETDYSIKPMPFSFVIELLYINEGSPVLLLDGDISPNYQTSFIEEGPPVSLVNVNSLSLTDPDLNPSNYTVTVRLMDPLQGDEERVDVNGEFPPLQINRSQPHNLIITGNTNIIDIEDAVRNIVYINAAEELNGTYRIIQFVVEDNYRGQLLRSSPVMTHITFIPVNDPPEIALQPLYINYTEGDFIELVGDISITDNDGSVITMAVINLTIFDDSEERIDIDTNGTNIIAEYSNNYGTIELTGNGTHTDYQQVLTTLTYFHSSEDATGGTRIVSIVVSDGDKLSEATDVMIFFQSINDAPVLDPNGPQPGLKFVTEFVEDTTATVGILSTDFILFDPDNSSLAYITLYLVDAPDGELEFLRIYNNGDVTDNQTIVINPGIINSSYITAFREVLATAEYINVAEEPTVGIRNVTFITSDGIDRSISSACIEIIPVNDAPQLDLNGNDTEGFNYYTTFIDSGGAIPITNYVIIEDNDENSSIAYFMISLRNRVYRTMEMLIIDSQDSLNCTTDTITFIRCDVTDFSTDQVINILNGVSYSNTNAEPTVETIQLDFIVSDGSLISNVTSAFINVTLVNEHDPQFTVADYSVSIQENQPAGTEVNINNFGASDDDSGRDGEITYSINFGNELEHFSINASTGVIYTNVMLDRENVSSYQLFVVATDNGVPPRNGMAVVQITVTDINDNAPEFAQDTNFDLSVSENASINEIIYSIVASDADGDDVLFSFEGGENVIGVTIDGRIMVMAILDADDGMMALAYTVNVTITDNGGQSNTATFTISVIDENDNLPMFQSDVYMISVSEGISPGDRIGEEIIAIDNDVTSNLTYSIANSSTFVVVDGQFITVAVTLDREIQDQYSFMLSVSDGLNNDITSVRIIVTDINDNAPVFDNLTYNFTVTENSVIFSEFVTATDADLGSNSEITYSVSGDIIRINSLTGEITLPSALDFETMPLIVFTVYASDNGSPPLTGSATVTITVEDVNEEVPVFTQAVYTVDVVEGIANVTVATVSLSNSDEAFEFSLDDDFSTFAIDPVSGEITAVISLDYETNCTYRLIVIATNLEYQNGSLQSTAIVEVLVTNVHDVAPMFNQSMYAVSVYENQVIGSVVAIVYATDDDSSIQPCTSLLEGSGSGQDQANVLNSELRYSINNHTDLFMINNVTGEITTRVRLDREENARYSVTITVADITNATDVTIVNIIVLDVNDNIPSFSRESYSVTVEENTPVGSSVLQVTANDQDMLDNGILRYTLPEEVTTFNISSITGIISISEPIDFDSGPTRYSFIASVLDSASQIDTASVTIDIIDLNDITPTVSNVMSSVTFTEGQTSLRSLSTINISDEDSFQTLTSAEVRLTVPGTAGAISANCMCSDPQDSSTCGPVGCNEFLQLQYDFPGMATLSQLNDSVILLSLTGTHNVSTYTSALRTIEYINIIRNPSVEPRTLYVTVNDGVFDSSPVMQNIIVEAFNEFIPELDLNGIDMDGNDFTTSFTEHGTPVSIVGEDVTILDNDTDGSLNVITSAVAEITNPLDGDLEYLVSTQVVPDNITIQGNASHLLTLTGEGSFEEYNQILLGLQYTNNMPELFLTPRVIRFTLYQYQHISEPVYTTVNIVGVNNHSPMIMLGGGNMQNYQTQFLEGSMGVPITSPSVSITDMDSGDDIILSLVIAPAIPLMSSDRIFISNISQLPSTITVNDAGSGHLTLNGPAPVADFVTAIRLVYYQNTDDEFVSPMSMRFLGVTVADSSLSSMLSFVTITLVSVNDQQPKFGLDLLEINVSESIPVGSVITVLTAVDNDTIVQPATIYSIVNDSSRLPFYLNRTTGELTNTRTLDSETFSRPYILIVQARDDEYNGVLLPDMLTLSILIEDENDNDPFFPEPPYNVSVAENITNGTTIITVMAIDDDVDEANRLIVYEIINNTDFVIDSDGNVITNTMLDRETQDFYELTIIASHPSDINSNATTFLDIYITDIDDSDHMLILNPDSGMLVEPMMVIPLSTMLTIIDNDINPTLDYATVQILPYGNTPPLGQLLSLRNTSEVTFTGNNSQVLRYDGEASIEEYEQLLRNVVYQDNADEPVPVTRQVEFIVGSQNITARSVFNISVTVINDNPPYLTLDNTNSTDPGDLSNVILEGAYFTSFLEDGDPIYITSQFLDITDADSGFNSLNHAIVYITNSRDTEQLFVNLTDNIQLTADSNDTWLNLTGPAAIEEFEDVLRRIRYINLADEPTGELREILFYVNDGLFDSNMALAYITINTSNDAPIVTLGVDGTVDIMLVYMENQSEPLLPAQYIQINDAENDSITIVSVIINNRLPEETLTISAATPNFSIMDTPTGLILIYAGGTSASEFEHILGTLEYQNSGTMAPDQLPRMISFTATDDFGLTSLEAIALINFESVDNPPMIDLNGNLIAGVNFTTVFTEGSSMIPIVSSQASITDVDSEELYLMVISFKSIPDLTAEDLVIQNTTGVLSVQRYRDNSSLCINITGQRSISDYLSVLMSVTYINMADEPNPAQREILIQAYSRDTIGGNLTVSNEAYSLINIAYINDHSPTFSSRNVYNGSVPEHAPAGTQVNVTVLATDNDRYGSTNITYRLPPEVVNFTVDSVTGIITTTDMMLDREVEDTITFTILAIDNDINMRTGSATVNINVLDVNDNSPMFSPLTFTPPIIIAEDTPIGVTIVNVTATDRDIGTNGQVMYRVSSVPSVSGSVGSGVSSVEPFGLVNDDGVAVLSLVQSLDRETVSQYTVTIEATDGTFMNAVTINVNVSDVNDNAPIFTNLPTSVIVSEGTPVGMELYQVTAEDFDLNAIIQYSLLNYTDIFVINSTTGAISLSNSLDYEQTQEYTLTIQALDSAPPSMTSHEILFIRVLNENEPPQFDPEVYIVEVDESSFIRIALNASDPENETLFYSFNEPTSSFNIDPLTGIVFSTNASDYENQQQINLTVQVMDSGNNFSTAYIFITVLDLNDNSPMFDGGPYSIAVSEDAPVNFIIATVTATDADSSSNGVVTYNIAQGNNDGIFRIDPNNGSIILTSSVDFETTSSYNLTVTAVDMGTPALTGTVIVQVNITDVNDRPPELAINESLVTYTENSDEILIAAGLEIMDDDGPLHPLMGAAIILDPGECRLSSNELQDACQQQESSCVSHCAERLTFNRDLLSVYGLTEQPSSTDHMIFITGNASEGDYTRVLRTLAYVNFADEPYAGDRTVSFQVTDDQNNTNRIGESNILNVTVRVRLIDEYCPVISSTLSTVTFVEGSNSTNVGQNVVFSVTDRDREPHKMLNMLEITLRNRQAEESISVTESSSLLVTSQMSGSDLTIRVQGAATVELYRQVLQTLEYTNTQDEPSLDQRLIVISPFVVEQLSCTPYNIMINITPINDNPPLLTTDTQTVNYAEGSGALMFAQSVGLRLTDLDHNDVFNITFAEVVLTSAQDGNSEIIGFSTAPPDGTDLVQENHRIAINYTAPVSVYNSLLRNLTYRNENPEPTPGMRVVQITVYDGDHFAYTMLIIIVVSINDNTVMLEAGNSLVVLSEETTELRIGQEAMLVLTDQDGEIASLRITLSDRVDQSEEIRIANSNSIISNGTSIFINRTMSVTAYQTILNDLVYSYPQATEPLAGNRTITISASDNTTISTVSITLQVELINDHNPIVDLNGPLVDGINYSTSVVFDYVTPNREAIATQFVNIIDNDNDAYIDKLEIRLNEESEDSLVLNLTNCYLPQGLDQISCQIMTVPEFSCVCDENLIPSQDLRTLTVNITQKAIIIVQPRDLVSFEIFQNLLGVVWFVHNPTPPSGSYTSVVSVVAFDGQFYSQPANTTITVELMPSNIVPILEESGATNVSVIVEDGNATIPIARNPTIASGDVMLQGMIVRLTNVIHTGEEYLNVTSTELDITLVSSSGEILIFSGTATVQSYAWLLQSIRYNYPRMSSIIDHAPDLSPRIIFVEVVDIEGRLSPSAQVTLTLDDVCSQTIYGDTIIISSMEDFEDISLCRGLELDLDIMDSLGSAINSLRPLNNLRFVRKLTIDNADILTNLEGLENLESYTSLAIIKNDGLTTLRHLSSNYPPLGLTVRNVYIYGNTHIQDFDGLQHIANVTGVFQVASNSMLRNLDGLNIVQVNYLVIFNLPLLTDLNVANNLWKANTININRNMALQRITGFRRLREIHTLLIENNMRLSSIDGLGGVLSVYSVTISSNPLLCYILNQNPHTAYWERLGAHDQAITVTIGSDCGQRSCSDDPCYNGGQCVMSTTADNYTCMCGGTDYYNGNDLQGCLFFNACRPEPCMNGGNCMLAELDLLGYRCECPDYFTGPNCEFENECDSVQPCENGGTCIDLVNDFSCECPDGFTGDTCEVAV